MYIAEKRALFYLACCFSLFCLFRSNPLLFLFGCFSSKIIGRPIFFPKFVVTLAGSRLGTYGGVKGKSAIQYLIHLAMHIEKFFLFLILGVLFVDIVSSCIREDEKTFELHVGDAIPDFTVQFTDGTTVRGVSLRKGVSVIVFFHIGCPDCQLVLPYIQRLYDAFLPDGVQFAVIAREQSQQEIAPYWEKLGFTMPYSPQSDSRVFKLFAGAHIPRVYVCSQGLIRRFYTDNPLPSYEELEADLQLLLDE